MGKTRVLTEEETNNIIKLYQIDNMSTIKIGKL
jgi:hypothetical protein